jgi:hypothetical protein
MNQALQTMATQSSPAAPCETAEDYKDTALQAMAIQPSSAALCSIPDNARHPLRPMIESNTVAEDYLSQPAVQAVAKITLQAACEAAVATRQQAQSTREEDSVAEVGYPNLLTTRTSGHWRPSSTGCSSH